MVTAIPLTLSDSKYTFPRYGHCEKCPNSEYFLVCIRTEYRDLPVNFHSIQFEYGKIRTKTPCEFECVSLQIPFVYLTLSQDTS